MARLKGAYPNVGAGEWVKPKRRYYYMACCDCGLVHKMEFALAPMPNGRGHGIFMRAWRDEEQTRALRRRRK